MNILKKTFILCLSIGLMFLLPSGDSLGKSGDPVLKGPFLGQIPPGEKPVIFAPGIVSTPAIEHGTLSVSPDGLEIYWSIISDDWQEGAVYLTREENGYWTKPGIAGFSRTEYRDLCPILSREGKSLFFTSTRPLDGKKGYNLWRIQRTGGKWSAPEPLPTTINNGCQSGCTMDGNNTLYFMSWKKGDPQTCDLFTSVFKDGKYLEPENMGPEINSSQVETSPFISPDGSYLLFSSSGRNDGMGGFDLYVSFFQENGSWSQAVNLGPAFNSDKDEWFPSVTPDGRYIFFISGKSGNADYYWVNAKVLKK